jgi:hypothetical protein
MITNGELLSKKQERSESQSFLRKKIMGDDFIYKTPMNRTLSVTNGAERLMIF